LYRENGAKSKCHTNQSIRQNIRAHLRFYATATAAVAPAAPAIAAAAAIAESDFSL
jgi:hypothetical protein